MSQSETLALINSYPEPAKKHLLKLRELIFDLAKSANLEEPEESLKWGEPSYRVKGGSTLRMDWKAKTPDEYYLFFVCNTKLIDTFKTVFSDQLQFQGNRAIVLKLGEDIPEKILRTCIEMTFRYHSIKHIDLLNIDR